MLAQSLATAGYKTSMKSTGDARSIEYRVFVQVTRALSSLDDSSPDYPARLAKALHENQRLWTILATDVADNKNPLPKHLRGQLFQLAEFTRVHTAKVHSGEATHDVLVDVNSAIMRGLRAQLPGAGS